MKLFNIKKYHKIPNCKYIWMKRGLKPFESKKYASFDSYVFIYVFKYTVWCHKIYTRLIAVSLLHLFSKIKFLYIQVIFIIMKIFRLFFQIEVHTQIVFTFHSSFIRIKSEVWWKNCDNGNNKQMKESNKDVSVDIIYIFFLLKDFQRKVVKKNISKNFIYS